MARKTPFLPSWGFAGGVLCSRSPLLSEFLHLSLGIWDGGGGGGGRNEMLDFEGRALKSLLCPALCRETPLGSPTTLQRKKQPKAQMEKKSPLKSRELEFHPAN